MNTQLVTKQAVLKVLTTKVVRSKYALAQALGIRPLMINNYLTKGTRMGTATAAKFEELYSITIADVYDNRSVV